MKRYRASPGGTVPDGGSCSSASCVLSTGTSWVEDNSGRFGLRLAHLTNGLDELQPRCATRVPHWHLWRLCVALSRAEGREANPRNDAGSPEPVSAVLTAAPWN